MLLEIPLTEIYADSDFNCRGRILGIDVVDLANDIKKNGLDSPVIVQEYSQMLPYKYRLVAGYRRFTAHQVIKKTKIMAIVKDIKTEQDARLLNMRENIIRKDLNILQEAKAVSRLIAMGMGPKEIAKEFSRSITWATVRTTLLDLPEDIQKEAAGNLINQKQIMQLSKLKTKDRQYEALRKIKGARFRGDATPRITEKIEEKATVKRRRKRTEIFYMMRHIQENIGNNFGTRVLAWVAGEICDADIFLEIERVANEKGTTYEKPQQSIAALVDHDPGA